MTDPAARHTPLYAQHVALGARMVPFAGWQMPVQYKGITQEHHAVRQAAGLFDVSHMGELFLEGPNARPILDGLITNDRAGSSWAARLHGRRKRSRHHPGRPDRYRPVAERYPWWCNAATGLISSHLGEHARRGRVEFSDRSDETR